MGGFLHCPIQRQVSVQRFAQANRRVALNRNGDHPRVLALLIFRSHAHIHAVAVRTNSYIVLSDTDVVRVHFLTSLSGFGVCLIIIIVCLINIVNSFSELFQLFC